ncbi:hypothetical protein IWW37_003783 [Coemansia sp. RSA 2050]|nr:hypothetical protein IWW37_003783 [Coemansia sp. RSA 2050]KAJ2732568.1 hypothetical protein IW152_003683 [Coemansia sp. BCRC 34962]
MGRAPKRTFKGRANPLGHSAVAGAATTVKSKEEVPVLLKKLSSDDANDRVWAAASSSNLLMSEDLTVRRLLLSNNVVSALIDCMADSIPDVILQVTGALHKLVAIDQGAAEEVCRKNIFGAIQALIPRLAKSIDDIIKNSDDGAKLTVDERNIVFQTTDNLISILWVLCETVPWSLKQINNMALIPFLISFFKVIGKLPASLVQTAGQFLYTLTDANAHAQHTLFGHPGATHTLFALVNARHGIDGVLAEDLAIVSILAGGILANIKPTALSQLEKTYKGRDGGIPEAEERPWDELSRALLQIISGFIQFDVDAAAETAAAAVQSGIAAHAESEANGAESPGGLKQEAALDQLNLRISYVQLALELAANIFTDEGAEDAELAADDSTPSEDDEDMADGDDDIGSDAEDVTRHFDENGSADEEDDVGVDFDINDMEDILADESTIAKEADDVVHQSILGVFIGAIVPLLQRLAKPTKMSTLATAMSECAQTTPNSAATKAIISVVESFTALHERALSCFNNVLLVIEESLKAWFRKHGDNVDQWWRLLIDIAQLLFGTVGSSADLADTDQRLRFAVLEPTISCMWTLARSAQGAVPATREQIEGLIHVCEQAPNSDLRVKAIGVLGSIACRKPGHVSDNQRIGTFLLDSVVCKSLLDAGAPAHSRDIEPIIEALDLIYDIYGDQAYDYDEPVFVRGGFLAKLRTCYLPMRKLVKTIDRRVKRELRDRGDLVVQNMRGFIDYKDSERRPAHGK